MTGPDKEVKKRRLSEYRDEMLELVEKGDEDAIGELAAKDKELEQIAKENTPLTKALLSRREQERAELGDKTGPEVDALDEEIALIIKDVEMGDFNALLGYAEKEERLRGQEGSRRQAA